MTDAELLQRVARAERASLAELYDRHASAMLAAALRITGDTREAEDLLHDLFLEVWQTATHYDPGRGSVRAWLLVRTRSRALDRRRRLRRSKLVPEDPAHELESSVTLPTPEAALVRSAVTRLPRELRVLLELGYYAGMSSAEIAAAVRIPIGTVKSRVARALAELRLALRGDATEIRASR